MAHRSRWTGADPADDVAGGTHPACV